MNLIFDFLIHETIWLLLESLKINFLIFKIIIIISYLSTLLILLLGKSYKLKPYNYIICLGHKLTNNNMSIDLINRLNKTIQYTKQDTIIILTGGITKGNTISEAKVMSEYLKKHNITNTLLLESESKTTIENILNIKNKYPEIINENILLISSDYHNFRAKQILKRFNINHVQTISAISLPKTFIKQMTIEKYCLITKK